MILSYELGGVTPLERWWAMEGPNLACRVVLVVILGPEGRMTVEKEGWVGRRALARY